MSRPVQPRSRLALHTFLAIAAAVALIGLIATPQILREVEIRYLALLGDTSRRQAEAYARFAEFRLQSGADPKEILAELNLLFAGADAERGFTCVIAEDSQTLLSHPVQEMIGQPTPFDGAEFAPLRDAENWRPFSTVLTTAQSQEGLLHHQDGHTEMIFLRPIPEVRWLVSTHENTELVSTELRGLRRQIIFGFILLGLPVAGLSAFAARIVSRRYETIIDARNREVESQRERAEHLLLNILPSEVADELKSGGTTLAKRHENVSVLFADLVGFTPLASTMPPEDTVRLLNRIFSRFDDLADAHGLEKIKTIGDSYMVCGGLRPSPAAGLSEIAHMALDMLSAMRDVTEECAIPLRLRVGIDCGPVVAGVIGKRKFSYDLWGDVVNTASRMESSGEPGKIHVTESVQRDLAGSFECTAPVDCEIKGKGILRTAYLVGLAKAPQPFACESDQASSKD